MPPEIREKHFLGYAVSEKTAVDEERRSIRFVVSTEEVDRDREVVKSDAMAAAIKGFADNPVCLAGHQHWLNDGMPPVVGSWDTESFKVVGKRSEMDLIFAKTALAEAHWQLYRERHMRAVSIGFRILDAYEEVKAGVRIFIITKIELYEISCVPVPANSSALSKKEIETLKAFGLLDDDPAKSSDAFAIKSLFDELFGKLKAELLDEIKILLEDNLEQVKDLIIPDPDGLAKALLPGSASEPADSAADDTGRLLNAIATTLQNKENSNAPS